jgi:hypothetical protein
VGVCGHEKVAKLLAAFHPFNLNDACVNTPFFRFGAHTLQGRVEAESIVQTPNEFDARFILKSLNGALEGLGENFHPFRCFEIFKKGLQREVPPSFLSLATYNTPCKNLLPRKKGSPFRPWAVSACWIPYIIPWNKVQFPPTARAKIKTSNYSLANFQSVSKN